MAWCTLLLLLKVSRIPGFHPWCASLSSTMATATIGESIVNRALLFLSRYRRLLAARGPRFSLAFNACIAIRMLTCV